MKKLNLVIIISFACFIVLVILYFSLHSAPQIRLINPEDESVLTEQSADLTFIVDKSYLFTGIKSCTLYLDGEVYGEIKNVSKNTSQIFHLENLQNKKYEWAVSCTDNLFILSKSSFTETRKFYVIPLFKETDVPACIDFDGGENYYVKGDTMISDEYHPATIYAATDYCINSYTLNEHFCYIWDEGGQTLASTAIECPNGCKDGACLEQPEELFILISPDGEENWPVGRTYNIKWTPYLGDYYVLIYLKKGEVNLGKINSSDVAASIGGYTWEVPKYFDSKSNSVLASPGNDYKVKIELYRISDSSKIAEDESDNYFSIITPADCTDSDGGRDYYVKGTVTAPDGKMVDQCETREGYDKNRLFESYCCNGKICHEVYLCPYGCEDGACLKK